jgi:hypothetical protein
MANATRRDVMRTLLAMPAAAAVASSFIRSAEAQPPTTSIPFNVVVHGGAVIEFNTQTLRVKVQLPDLKDHCYLAGYWGVESALEAGENYSFGTTILGGNQLPPSLKKGQTKDFPIIRQRLTAGKPPRNSFDLPFPTDIVSAYSAKCLGQKAFFKSGSPLEFQPKTLPLVSVLQYNFLATTAPALVASSSFSWVPQINFHIFAELPTDQIPNGHAADLLNAEQDLYSELSGHRIIFSDDVVSGKCEYSASVAPPPGVSDWETMWLAKRVLPTCPPFVPTHGGHPASCMSLIVIE